MRNSPSVDNLFVLESASSVENLDLTTEQEHSKKNIKTTDFHLLKQKLREVVVYKKTKIAMNAKRLLEDNKINPETPNDQLRLLVIHAKLLEDGLIHEKLTFEIADPKHFTQLDMSIELNREIASWSDLAYQTAEAGTAMIEVVSNGAAFAAKWVANTVTAEAVTNTVMALAAATQETVAVAAGTAACAARSVMANYRATVWHEFGAANLRNRIKDHAESEANKLTF